MNNGNVTYSAEVGGKKIVIKTVRGRITAKRVSIGSRTWDKNGKRVSRYTGPWQMIMRLLSYQEDGKPEIIVKEI